MSGAKETGRPRRAGIADEVRTIKNRQKYLPGQLAATRRKLEMLRREAYRLGMPELVIADEEAAKAMRQERWLP